MSREILLLVDALAREKNVDKEVVFGALEVALASATKKRVHDDADVRVAIDRDSGEYESFRRWLVLPDEEVTNDEAEMGIIDARETHPDIEVGDYVEETVEGVEFGRVGGRFGAALLRALLADHARHLLAQRLRREAELSQDVGRQPLALLGEADQ